MSTTSIDNRLSLLEYVLVEMEENQQWSPGRAWILLTIGMANLDVLNVDRNDLDAVIKYLTDEDGGHSEDYYQTWQDMVDHAKANKP